MNWWLVWGIGTFIAFFFVVFIDGYMTKKGGKKDSVFEGGDPGVILLFLVVIPALWPILVGIVLPGVVVWHSGQRFHDYAKGVKAKKKEKAESISGHFGTIVIKEK